MNNSAYYNYGHRIFYQFNNGLYQIPVLIYPYIEIQLLDTVTWAPRQLKEHIDSVYPSIEDTSFIGLINKARLNIHNPNRVVIDISSTQHTKQERMGFSSASSSSSGRRFVFTRGLKNVQ